MNYTGPATVTDKSGNVHPVADSGYGWGVIGTTYKLPVFNASMVNWSAGVASVTGYLHGFPKAVGAVGTYTMAQQTTGGDPSTITFSFDPGTDLLTVTPSAADNSSNPFASLATPPATFPIEGIALPMDITYTTPQGGWVAGRYSLVNGWYLPTDIQGSAPDRGSWFDTFVVASAITGTILAVGGTIAGLATDAGPGSSALAGSPTDLAAGSYVPSVSTAAVPTVTLPPPVDTSVPIIQTPPTPPMPSAVDVTTPINIAPAATTAPSSGFSLGGALGGSQTAISAVGTGTSAIGTIQKLIGGPTPGTTSPRVPAGTALPLPAPGTGTSAIGTIQKLIGGPTPGTTSPRVPAGTELPLPAPHPIRLMPPVSGAAPGLSLSSSGAMTPGSSGAGSGWLPLLIIGALLLIAHGSG